MNKRKIMKKVVLVVAILFVVYSVSPALNAVYGKLNEDPNLNFFQADETGIDIVGSILGTALGPLGTALSSVVLLVVGILALLLSAIFGPISGQWGFPGMDQIIFNKVALFDPNFINSPDPEIVSLSGMPGIQEIIKQVYQTGYVVGGSIFVIGAMVIGIKLAVTSIASEKAYYKELVWQWIKSLVLLFSVHFLIAGAFALNEFIVEKISVASNIGKIAFTIQYELPGLVGKVVTSIVNFFMGQEPTTKLSFKAFGLTGLTYGLILKAVVEGDLISAIAVAGLLGQTCALMITYLKRTIVCILLAAIAPFVIAVDFLKKLV